MVNSKYFKRLFFVGSVLAMTLLYSASHTEKQLDMILKTESLEIQQNRPQIDHQIQEKGTDNFTSLKPVTDSPKELDCKVIKPGLRFLLVPSLLNATCERHACFKNKSAHISWNLFAFVKSYAYNFEQREFIRRTWASYIYVNGLKLRTVFVLGSVGRRTQSIVEEESKRYGDILQIDIIEDEQNIAQKVIGGMQWASDNLPQNYLYASVDGDVLLDLIGVHQNINKFHKLSLKHRWPEFPIVCMSGVRFTEKLNRRLKSKDYVSRESYKWPFYPKFCLGGLYATSVRIARLLFTASRTEEQLNRDDAWITGVLRLKIGMTSEMVLNVLPIVAHHYHDEFNRNNEQSRSLLQEEWEALMQNLEHVPHCICA